jgi:hypothetical protein
METRKFLRMRYNYDEVAQMLDVSTQTLRNELRRSSALSAHLSGMGLGTTYKKPLKKHVIEIFRYFGFPDGYEHYETITN